MWQKIKHANGNNSNFGIQYLKTDQNQALINAKEIANTLAEKFKSNSSKSNYPAALLSNTIKRENEVKEKLYRRDKKTIDPVINFDIFMNELTNCLQSTKDSSPSPNNIPNRLLKNLPTGGKSNLLQIYNCIWTYEVFPNNWRKATVVPILKPDKNKYKPESYCPIALTNNMCKLLEKTPLVS